MILVDKLQTIVGQRWVITDRERMIDYLTDETAAAVKPEPASELILVKPANSREVSKILKLANRKVIPVFPGEEAQACAAAPSLRRTASSCRWRG